MSCFTTDCDGDRVFFSVPPTYRAVAPEGAERASICGQCLRVDAVGDDRRVTDGVGAEGFTAVSDSFPVGDAAIPFAFVLGLSSSLATNRGAIEELLVDVETAGTDPLLAIDRLLADPDVEPAVDLDRRRHQIEQLLY